MRSLNISPGSTTPIDEFRLAMSRRHFFNRCGVSLGTAALASMLSEEGLASASHGGSTATGGLPDLPHFAPKAKRVIYLFQSGGPSQLDLFDHKPKLASLRGTELPESIRQGQRLTGMTSSQASFPIAPSIFGFKQRGESAAWVS